MYDGWVDTYDGALPVSGSCSNNPTPGFDLANGPSISHYDGFECDGTVIYKEFYKETTCSHIPGNSTYVNVSCTNDGIVWQACM